MTNETPNEATQETAAEALLPPPWREADRLAATWRAMVEERVDQLRRLVDDFEEPSQGYWNARAADFRSVLDQPQPDAFLQRVLTLVDKDSTVLDVGAGVGRYALPLAQHVRSITAVEPAEGMTAILREEMAQRHVDNIQVVSSSWEDARVEPADIVICSHVVYSARDIAAFARKLRQNARRAVVIAVRVDQFDAYVRPLWHELYGVSRAPEPGFLELYAILLAQGVAPEVETVDFGVGRGFASLKEATAYVMTAAHVPPYLEVVAWNYARTHMEQRPDKTWAWALPPIRSAILWWDEQLYRETAD